MQTPIDTSILDKIIVGRVMPTIYAFQTNTFPNYVKIGDTYRPVKARLGEWSNIYKDLELLCTRPAVLESGRYFRDYSIHEFLIRVKHIQRLREEQAQGKHYSREFFENVKETDIDEAIDDIKESEKIGDRTYKLYSEDKRPAIVDYQRDSTPIKLRDIQQETVDNFIKAYKNNQTNLLMYAVMRFGKSITAMSCAVAMDAKLVVVVCGKVDVEDEWRKTVKKTANFEGFDFVNSTDLKNGFSIKDHLQKEEKLVVFLSLQDIQGDNVKEKHKELFDLDIDLVIVDETHFGARADKYGEILKQSQLNKKEIKQETEDLDSNDGQEANIKAFKYKVLLHLSGTPYRILMSNNEFKPEDIIAFYQFTDIIKAQKEWDEKFLGNDGVQEWENPYYGFPQMIRFAFNPNKSAQDLLNGLKSKGITYAFAELFKPKSITKDRNGLYKKFKHEKEILELFELIDGGNNRTEKGFLSFLNYEPIKNGNMCRHIVVVLPFKASCDALEELFRKYADTLPNISQYNIINIAGLDSQNLYPNTSDVKRRIKELENQGVKTITLTVNRMLTGTTVEQWDTMIYLKDTLSPQDYDQAIFRIQNQYIQQYIEENNEGEKDIIKRNMKPQTLLVDFLPDRMMQLQELKSKYYNVNTIANGNDLLEERIKYELEISPIITANENKLVQVEAKDIMELVRNYSHSKSILDEALSIPFDSALLLDPDIMAEINKMDAIDNPKGLNFRPYDNEDDDHESNLEIDDEKKNKVDNSGDKINKNNEKVSENKEEKLDKKLAAYYSLLLFFSFLTSSRVRNLRDIIHSIEENKDDSRIAKNIGLRLKIIQLLLTKGDAFIRSDLEYAIDHINSLMLDDSMTPLERVSIAVNKFNRISDSEVITPQSVSDEIVNIIPQDKIDKDSVFLDIASKQGEMAIALIKKYGERIDLCKIYAIPTSRLSYELTRKVYSVLGLPVKNVLSGIYSSDFIGDKNSENFKRIKNLQPTIIMGGPPFNSNDGGGRSGDSASALYHDYIIRAMEIEPEIISMFAKAVWYSGGKGTGLKEFRSKFIESKNISTLSDYPDASKLGFPSTLRGGICLFTWDKHHEGETKVINHINQLTTETTRYLKHKDLNIFIRFNDGLGILDKVLEKGIDFYGNIVSSRNPFGLADNIMKSNRPTKVRKIKMYDVKKKVYYVSPNDISKGKELIDEWKVLVAKASPGGDELPHKIISEPLISEPHSIGSGGLLLVSTVKNKKEAENLITYMKTKFFRFMMILAKNAHNLTKDVYRFVPKVDLTRKWDDKSLYQYFGISKEEQAYISKIIKEWQ